MAQTLSEDVLFMVFLHALPAIVANNLPIDIRNLPPLNFSQVCRSWRAVVSSHPSLWGSIRVDYYDSYRSNPFPYMDDFLKSWLLKSASAPLDITLDFKGYQIDTVKDKLLSMVLDQNHRLKIIHLTYRQHSGVTSVLPSITVQCLPSNVSLNLDVRYPACLKVEFYSCTMHGAESQLQQLWAISSVRTTWLFTPDLYLPNLRILSLGTTVLGPKLVDTLLFLSACPNLWDLTIHVQAVSSLTSARSQARSQDVLLRKLNKLVFESTDRSTDLGILGHLYCPSLQTFKYQSFLRDPDLDHDGELVLHHLRGFGAFFSRSRPPLSMLSLGLYLTDSPTSEEFQREYVEELKSLLGLLNGLKQLILSNVIINDDLIRSLTIHAGENRDDTLCPSLTDINLCCMEAYDIKSKTCEDMIISRWALGEARTLRAIILDIPDIDDCIWESERVQRCMEEGLIWSA